MSSDPTAIEKKQAEKDEADGKATKEDDWANFGIATAKNFFYALIYGLIGANIIYFSTRTKALLEVYFPIKNSFYGMKDTGGQEGGGARRGQQGGGFTCEAPKFSMSMPDVTALKGMLGHIGVGQTGWPYTWIKEEPGIRHNIGLLLALTYQKMRSLVRAFFALFSPSNLEDRKAGPNSNPLSSNPLQIILALLLFAFPPVTGIVTTGLVVVPAVIFMGILLFFSDLSLVEKFLYGFGALFTGFPLGLGIIAAIQMLVTLVFLPLYGGGPAVKKILKCNINSLVVIFGALTMASAVQNLSNTTTGMMLIAFIVMLIKMAFF